MHRQDETSVATAYPLAHRRRRLITTHTVATAPALRDTWPVGAF